MKVVKSIDALVPWWLGDGTGVEAEVEACQCWKDQASALKWKGSEEQWVEFGESR